MANYTPTCSEYSIDVPAPKDAEGRRVLLDTKFEQKPPKAEDGDES